jgi:hypothetical protein
MAQLDGGHVRQRRVREPARPRAGQHQHAGPAIGTDPHQRAIENLTASEVNDA